MKKLFNLKLLTILFFLTNFIFIGLLYFIPGEIDSLTEYDLSITAIFFSVIFAPFSEEIIYRYWAYGKNILLQFSLFITFIIFIITDLLQSFVFYNLFQFTTSNNTNAILRNCIMLLIALFLYVLIRKSGYIIPSFFYKIIQSGYTFYFIIFTFTIGHLYHTEFNIDNLYNYLSYFILSYLITRHAREYGIYFAIFFHFVNNLTSTFYEAIEVNTVSKKLISDQFLIIYLVPTIFFITFYFTKLLKAKPLSLNQR